MNGVLPLGWSSSEIPAALDQQQPIIRSPEKVAARDYLMSGRFPIIDQGKTRVGGWTDRETIVLRPKRPVVVFGDHSRTFKYVDFPFATGADGTLILNPSDKFDPEFFFFACLNLDIPSRGYNRHYTLLREMSVPRPPLEEQRKIAAVLGKVQAAVELEGDLIRVTRELKQAALRQFFSWGVRGEAQKQTELGPIPESWKVVEFSNVREFLQYGTSVKCSAQERGVPVLRIPNVLGGSLSISDLKYAELSKNEVEKLELAKGDLLFVRTNGQRHFIGRCAVYKGTPDRAVYASYLIRARVNTSILNPDFFQYYSETNSGRTYLAGQANGAADGKFNLNTQAINAVLVPLPSLPEQQEIASHLAAIDAKIAHHEARQKLLRELFRTLLGDLMTGRRRVTELPSNE